MADRVGVYTALILGGLFSLVYLYQKSRRGRGKLPPGPLALPLVGNLPFLGSDPREPLMRLSKKYGDVFTVYFARKPVVILNSYEAIREALVKHGNAFADRPQNAIFQDITDGMGIVFSNGDMWREQRKFAHGVLRDFGMGKSFLEASIHEEISCYINRLHEQANKPYSITQLTQKAASNVICSIVFGKRYDYDDLNFKRYLQCVTENIKALGGVQALSLFPSLRHLPGDFFGYKAFMGRVTMMIDFFNNHIKQHRETYDPSNSRDFIDAYIVEIEKEKNKGNQNSTFHDRQMLMVIGDLFGAGTETTVTTLSWGIIYLLHNPEIQEKVKAEIQDVIGLERLPSMADKSRLPYTEATIMEIQRLGDIVPLGVPRMTAEDVEFRGYLLPKGTMVFPHLYAVHKDPNIWKDPHIFDPTRFLSSDGQKVENKELLIPFSMGRRVCLGESMARMELFLFFTTLMQNFTFKPVPDQPLPSLKGTLGATYCADDFDVIMVPN